MTVGDVAVILPLKSFLGDIWEVPEIREFLHLS